MTKQRSLKYIVQGPSDRRIEKTRLGTDLLEFWVRLHGSRRTKLMRLVLLLPPIRVSHVTRAGALVTGYELVGLSQDGNDTAGQFIPVTTDRTKGHFLVNDRTSDSTYCAAP